MSYNLVEIQKVITDHVKATFGDIKLEFADDVDGPYDGDVADYTVLVPRDRYDEFIEYSYDDEWRNLRNQLQKDHKINIQVSEIKPQLFPAEVGDFVLIYSDTFYKSDEESYVGVVASKRIVNNEAVYGVRYIMPVLGNSFAKKRQPWDHFEVTGEKYGGWHSGFLQILSKKEMEKRLYTNLEVGYRNALKDIDKRLKDGKKAIVPLLDALQNGKIVDATYLYVDRDGPGAHDIPEDMDIPTL